MKVADDAEYIKRRMEEIEAERWANIAGQPIEAPVDIDTVYGIYPSLEWQTDTFSVDAPD